jgi:hypothetical protein
MTCIGGCIGLAHAGALEAQPAPPVALPDVAVPHVEMWGGGEASQDAWSAYTGASWAPFGDVRADGFRMRAVMGTGGYRVPTGTGTVTGSVAFGDMLIGYQKQLGPVAWKLFGGVSAAEHSRREPFSGVGGKGVIEAWWTITDKAWVSADLSLTSLHMSAPNPGDVDYGGRVRAGWRLQPLLSVGLEGGSAGPWETDIDPKCDTARFGGFLRYEWAKGEVSVSGGLAFDEREGAERRASPFATVSVLTRF